jgi:nitrogen fixation NifU-like protein
MSENRYKKFIELFKNPINRREMENPDITQEGQNTCGDKLTIYLKIKDGKIADASYEGAFCAFSNASASQVTQFVKGMTLEEVDAIDNPKLFKLIGDDLSDNPHRLSCILFPLRTVKEACKKFKEHGPDKIHKKPKKESACHCDEHNAELGL